MFDTIRNLGAIFGGIAALVTLWRLFHGRPKVVATATHSFMRMLPTTEQQRAAFADLLHEEMRQARTERRSTASSSADTAASELSSAEKIKGGTAGGPVR